MIRTRAYMGATVAISIAISAPQAIAQKRYDVGASDNEIRIGQTIAFSGPYSVYSVIGRTQAAYMKMINEQGGINGRKINLIQYDDAYTPPKTVEQVRKLVESDEVYLMFNIVGTASSAAVQKYLNTKKVPQLLTATGAARFADPEHYPWTIGFNPNYQSEGRIYAKFILEKYPNAKIAVLYQNDDLGRDYYSGLKAGLGDKASSMIVSDASFEVSDPTIDSQIVKLKTSGADVFFNASTPRFAAQAIKKVSELNWKPTQILISVANSVSATLRPAGLEASNGIISTAYSKDASDPKWQDDPALKKYFSFMEKYYPGGDKLSSNNVYAYTTSELLVTLLQQCGDDLTRENVMRQATSLNSYTPSLALPGILFTTKQTDYVIIKQLQMVRFNGERWESFGPVYEGSAGVE